MQNLRRLLPSANSLIVFEAAGRLLSFTRAAEELGMTQAAVSYAIARLERQLSTRLFDRGHRTVRLTEAGSRFFADVSLGLAYIQRSAGDLHAAATENQVTLSASTAFAAFWMVPRLQKLREDLPEIDLRIQTADRDLDLDAEGIPLGIRGGAAADWPHYETIPLAPERIHAVCGTSYLARFGRPGDVEALLSHRLIHLEEPHRPAATWHAWFAAAGIDPDRTPRGLRINDYVLVIQSVVEGQGVALGWEHLVADQVRRGVLVRLTEHSMTTGHAFHVAWPKRRRLTPAATEIRDWLVAQAGSGGRIDLGDGDS